MSFFKKIFGVIASLGFVITLFIICSLIVILNTTDSKKELVKNNSFEIYQKENVRRIEFYQRDNSLKIDIEFKEIFDKKYYLGYGYYYFDKYNYPIELYINEINKEIIINIMQDSSAYITSDNL